MTSHLAQKLKNGVPEAPDLDGLARRAERLGRRRRGRRRAVIAAVAVACVTAVAVIGLDTAHHGRRPEPATDTACVGDVGASATNAAQDASATYARFCPTPRSHLPAAFAPDAVLTADTVDVVDRLDHTTGCAAGTTRYEIQVGHVDGTVRILRSACPEAFELLAGAIARQQATSLAPPTLAPERCGGGAPPSVGPDDAYRSLPVVRAYRCTILPSGRTSIEQLTPAQGETLRLASLQRFRVPVDNDPCLAIMPGPSLVLDLADASRHVVGSTGGCNEGYTIDGTVVGSPVDWPTTG